MENRQLLDIACPCCKQICDSDHLYPLREMEREIRSRDTDPWRRSEGWADLAALSGELQWACTRCLVDGTALQANPNLQNFCDFNPYFAYFDITLQCVDCNVSFVFQASEQSYWYESLRFLVQSRPNRCLPCRRNRCATSQSEKRVTGRVDEPGD